MICIHRWGRWFGVHISISHHHIQNYVYNGKMLHIELDAGTSARKVIYLGSAALTQWTVQNYAPTIETICYNCNILWLWINNFEIRPNSKISRIHVDLMLITEPEKHLQFTIHNANFNYIHAYRCYSAVQWHQKCLKKANTKFVTRNYI